MSERRKEKRERSKICIVVRITLKRIFAVAISSEIALQ